MLVSAGYQTNFSITLETDWTTINNPFFIGTADSPVLINPNYNSVDNCSKLIDLFVVYSNIFNPQFGWIEKCKESGFTKKEYVNQLKIPFIYWANYYSPDYVNKYGLDYFSKAPGFKKEELSNGGFLYVLTPTIKAGPKKLLQEVQVYFQIDGVRKPLKKKS